MSEADEEPQTSPQPTEEVVPEVAENEHEESDEVDERGERVTEEDGVILPEQADLPTENEGDTSNLADQMDEKSQADPDEQQQDDDEQQQDDNEQQQDDNEQQHGDNEQQHGDDEQQQSDAEQEPSSEASNNDGDEFNEKAPASEDIASEKESQEEVSDATGNENGEEGNEEVDSNVVGEAQQEAPTATQLDALEETDSVEEGKQTEDAQESSNMDSDNVDEGEAAKEDSQSEVADETEEGSENNEEDKVKSTKQQIVRVQQDDGSTKLYNLTIVDGTYKKPYLGGFRNKVTEAVYHNASTQTPRRIKMRKVEVFERTTQTKTMRTHPKFATQTAVDAATQMSKPGVYVTRRQDKVIVPGKYETAAEKFAKEVNAVIIIQKYYRRWKAQRFVDNLRFAKKQYELWEEEKLQRKREMEEEAERRDLERRLNPRTEEDFDLLYSSLEAWHQEQSEKIKQLPESEQKRARMSLLKEQTRYLNSINQLKLIADVDNKEKRIERFLDKATGGDRVIDKEYGLRVHVEHPENKRAQQLRSIYNAIKVPDLQLDERLDALFSLKSVVSEFNTPLTREIQDLIKRESDLLSRRIRARSLEGLRKRILNLYVQFMETPEYNPIAKKLLKVHKDKEYFKHNMVKSVGSESFQTKEDFEVSPLMTAGLGKSKAAIKAENRAIRREDNTVYRKLLEKIRLSEKKYNDNSLCMFLLTVRDLKYLVDTIWNKRSAMSEDDDINVLVLCRWDKTKELSPWNCILLEEDECEAHLALPDAESSYDSIFKSRIVQRHLRAKQHFSTLRAHLAKARKQQKSADNDTGSQTLNMTSSSVAV